MGHVGRRIVCPKKILLITMMVFSFCHIGLDALNKHEPRKKKHTRGNQLPFFNKKLSKAIMTQTKLRNIFLQNRSEENRIPYTKQRNLFIFL